MKKLIVLFMVVLSVLLLAKTTLTIVEVFTSPERDAILKNIIKKFEEQNPGVEVNLISPPYETAYQKIYTMISNKQPIDIVEVGDWSLSTLAAMGGLENLEPYIAKWDGAKYMLPNLLEFARIYKGKAYLIPNAVYAKTLFVRKDVLKKYGIEHAPKTVFELYGMASYLTNPRRGQYGYDFRGKGYPTDFIDLFVTSFFDDIDPNNMYLTKDGKLIWSDPRAKYGLELYVKLFKNTAPKDAVNWGFSEQINSFVSGITPLLYQDPDSLGILKGNLPDNLFETDPLPVGPYGKAYPHYGFSGWGIVSYSKHKDLAWKFIEFFNSPKILSYWCKNYGVLPPDKRVYENDPYFKSDKYKGWIEMFNDPKHYQFTKQPIWSEAWGKWTELQERTMQEVLLGKKSIDQVLKEWSKFWEKAGLK